MTAGRAGRVERWIFFVATSVIAVRVLDDNFIQPGGRDGAGEPKGLWAVAAGGHLGSQAAEPEEFERRVVRFFDAALLGSTAKGSLPPRLP